MDEERLYLAEDADLLGQDDPQPGEEHVVAEGLTERDFQEVPEITFEKYDGTKEVYEVISMFEDRKGERSYMAMIPKGAEDPEEVFLVPFGIDGDGKVQFRDFYSDEEYEEAQSAMAEYHGDPDSGDGSVESADISAEEAAEALTEADKDWIRNEIRQLKEL